MSSLKELKLAQKAEEAHRHAISELNELVQGIERCEKTILNLKRELETVNTKYQGPRTTRDDVAYLTDLLECAKKKLTWEKLMTSLQKRTPEVLAKVSNLFNDPKNPPTEENRVKMVQSLQSVQAAMESLQNAKTD